MSSTDSCIQIKHNDAIESETVAKSREDRDNFDFESEFQKLCEQCGVPNHLDSSGIVLREETLKYLNRACYNKGNTFLIQCIEFERLDALEYCLKFDGLDINALNLEKKTAADIAWLKKHYICLLKLLCADSEFPTSFKLDDIDLNANGGKELREFVKKRSKLHHLIRDGDLNLIKQMLQSENSSFYLSLENQTAISSALQNNQFEVYAYLLFVGGKLSKGDRQLLCRLPHGIQERLKISLEDYFIQDENSHSMKLVVSSKLLGEFSNARKDSIKRLFEDLNEVKFIRFIMKVLEYQDIDVIFDFDSEVLDRVYGANCSKVFGLAVPDMRRVYVGAKKCESDVSVYRNVAGTLAHELCHLCMDALYKNHAKPYTTVDVQRITEFSRISDNIRVTVKGTSGDIDNVIKVVFSKEYRADKQHAELIVRVPHILGIYGETEGAKILEEQVPDLLEYYSTKVFPDCERYSEQTYFTKPLCSIEHLHKYRGLVQGKDREISPLQESIRSFREYVKLFRNMSVIITSNISLCPLHVYHELKRKFQFHLEKRCLFFDSDCFYKYRDDVLNAFRCKACQYFVLVTKDKNPGFQFLSTIIGTICSDEEKEVILILDEGCKDPEENWERKVLHYYWNDLSDSLKYTLSYKRVKFQGRKMALESIVGLKLLPDIIKPEVLTYLMANDNIQIGDERHLWSPGYDEKLYIERTLVQYKLNEMVKNIKTGSYRLFISGLAKEELGQNSIDENIVQVIDVGDVLNKDVRILLAKQQKTAKDIFEEVFQKGGRKGSGENEMAHWVHFHGGDYYWRNSNRKIVMTENFHDEVTIGELELIEETHKRMDRIVLLSDDPGTGKSTMVTNLINKIKYKWPDVFVGRLDFNEYADDDKSPTSLANIKDNDKTEEVLSYFFKIIRLENPLEVCLVKSFLGDPGRIKIFFDGFDEIVPFYKEKALKLLRTLKNNTSIQLWVTTRNHERLDLEIELNVFSYSMKPCTAKDQARFLSSVWKREIKAIDIEQSEDGYKGGFEYLREKFDALIEETELSLERHKDSDIVKSLRNLKESIDDDNQKTFKEKYDNLRSGIVNVDFTSYANVLLENVSSAIKDEAKTFFGLPLHLLMLANMAYHENFKLKTHSDRFHFYSDFVEKKIHIYLREKCRIIQETQGSIHIHRILKRVFLEAHLKISECVINPEEFRWETLTHNEEMDCIHDIGVVTKMEDHFQFTHHSFAEFFFSERVLKMIRSGELEEEMLKNILLKDRYVVVLRFLDGAFQDKAMEAGFSKSSIEKWKLKEFYPIYIDKVIKGDLDGKYILRSILANVEKEYDFNSFKKFIKDTLTYITLNMNTFKLLSICLTDAMLIELFDKKNNPITRSLSDVICDSSSTDISEVIKVFKRMLQFKVSCPTTYGKPATFSQGNEGNGNDTEIPSDTRRRLFIFDADYGFSNTILHIATHNRDGNVCIQMLSFVKEALGEEGTRDYLSKTNSYGRTVIHESILYNMENLLTLLREIETTIGLLLVIKQLNDKFPNGQSVLHLAALLCHEEALEALFKYMGDIGGMKLLKEFLLQEDKYGMTTLHVAAYNKDIQATVSILRNARKVLEDEEFEGFVMRVDSTNNGEGNSVFHKRAVRVLPVRDLIILEPHIGRVNLCELIVKKNKCEMTWLHLLVRNSSSAESVLSDISFVSKLLDGDSFGEFLLATDSKRLTFLNIAEEGRAKYFADILNGLKEMLSEMTFSELMNTKCMTPEVVSKINSEEEENSSSSTSNEESSTQQERHNRLPQRLRNCEFF